MLPSRTGDLITNLSAAGPPSAPAQGQVVSGPKKESTRARSIRTGMLAMAGMSTAVAQGIGYILRSAMGGGMIAVLRRGMVLTPTATETTTDAASLAETTVTGALRGTEGETGTETGIGMGISTVGKPGGKRGGTGSLALTGIPGRSRGGVRRMGEGIMRQRGREGGRNVQRSRER